MQDVWAIVKAMESRGTKPTMMAAMRMMETAIKLAKRKSAKAEEGAKIESWVKSNGLEADVPFYSSWMDLQAKAAMHGMLVSRPLSQSVSTSCAVCVFGSGVLISWSRRAAKSSNMPNRQKHIDACVKLYSSIISS
jgi:hypothetical protein